jgi:hypothetical protein
VVFDFGVFTRKSARFASICAFQKPIKYARAFDINQNTVHATAARHEKVVHYQRVTLSKGALPTIAP